MKKHYKQVQALDCDLASTIEEYVNKGWQERWEFVSFAYTGGTEETPAGVFKVVMILFTSE